MEIKAENMKTDSVETDVVVADEVVAEVGVEEEVAVAAPAEIGNIGTMKMVIRMRYVSQDMKSRGHFYLKFYHFQYLN